MIFGSMFNRWPYTDLQNLNLDWLIGVCKDITTNWPPKFEEIENEINKKLDKALNDGTLGDILTNNGNGTYTWKPFDDAISNQIIQAVNNWLANHPEATTTVQDGAITPAKLDNELYTFYKQMGHVQFFVPHLYEVTEYASGCTCLMVTPTETVLFDTGEAHHATEIIDYYNDLLTDNVFSNIDKIIISHYHYDHVDNLEAILQSFPHDNCKIYLPISPSGYYAGAISPTLVSCYNEVIRVATDYNLTMVTVNSDTTLTIDNLVSINMFNSDPTSYAYYSDNQYPYNDYSMVALIRVGTNYAMMPGDLGLEGQKRIMTYKDLPRVMFYLVNHHGVNNGMQGSDTNRDYTPFIYKINPLYAIVPANYNTQKSYFQFGIFQKLFSGFLGSTAYDSYSFSMSDAGGAITHGMAIYNGGVNNSYITLYVDNSYTGEIHDGTQSHPFTQINEAIGFIKETRAVNYYIRVYKTETPYNGILCRNINMPIQIRAFEDANPPTIKSAIIENCHRIDLSYLIFKGAGIADHPVAGSYSTITILNSTVVFSACTLNGEENTAHPVAISTINSKLKINTATIKNYEDGVRPYGLSLKSMIECVNLTIDHVGEGSNHGVFFTLDIEVYIQENFVYTNVDTIFLGNQNRGMPIWVIKASMTQDLVQKCTGSVYSQPQFYDSTHPIVMISNSKLYDLLTGDVIIQ